MQKTKKDLNFFGFSQFLDHQFIQKTQNKFFQGHDQNKQKKLEENQQKSNMSLRPNIL